MAFMGGGGRCRVDVICAYAYALLLCLCLCFACYRLNSALAAALKSAFVTFYKREIYFNIFPGKDCVN